MLQSITHLMKSLACYLPGPFHAWQAAVKRPKAKPAPKPAEALAPKTLQDVVKELANERLKKVSMARTNSVSLDGLDFAEDLSQTMLTHCNTVEAKYKEVQNAIRKGTSDAALRAFQKSLEALDKETTKLQARTNLKAFG